ncbi:hypothetical protein FM125_09555 [Micrococcus lylae]|uniref:Uncharacterized protein n=1 Tax=Micrococcus lylae TaxID=1273 RepID=A0A1R4JM50_9MICC|nr:hypothetical protein FM125_09555 [Micrococcus lylae]
MGGQAEAGSRRREGGDDTQATDSLPRWAAEDGHEVTEFTKRGAAEWTIVVKKG